MLELPPFERPKPLKVESTLLALRSHYVEMPGLSLTPAQARRLCGLNNLDLTACERILERLVEERFLLRSNDGRYRRAS